MSNKKPWERCLLQNNLPFCLMKVRAWEKSGSPRRIPNNKLYQKFLQVLYSLLWIHIFVNKTSHNI